MAFRDTQNFVDRFDPVARHAGAANGGRKSLAQRALQTLGAREQGFGRSLVDAGQPEKLCTAFRRDYRSGFEKSDQTLPGKRPRLRAGKNPGEIDKIDGKAAAKGFSLLESRGHVGALTS